MIAAHTSTEATVRTASQGGQFLSFRLGGECYGIDILKVQEIRSYDAPTRMPNSAEFLRGVIDIRGVIVPILDLRVRFQCPSAEFTPSTVVIVLDLGARVVGVVADAVNDVVSLQAADVRAAPSMAGAIDASCITGLAQSNDELLILLDVDLLLSERSLAQAGVQPLALAA